MEKKEQLYEGKAKKVFATDNADYVIVSYKDDATAFNGLKKGTIAGKGVINNKMSNLMMQMLEKKGIPTHFVEQIDDRNTVVKKVEIVPLEVIIRNVAAGSFSKKYGVAEGTALLNPTIEFSYKNDDLGDPLINTYHALALGLATKEEIDTITKMAFAVNEAMKEFFKHLNIDLVDFKLEFGVGADKHVEQSAAFLYRAEKTAHSLLSRKTLEYFLIREMAFAVNEAMKEFFKHLNIDLVDFKLEFGRFKGQIVLADEISPDTCRFWEAGTWDTTKHVSLDKDRFRRDLGGVEDAYLEFGSERRVFYVVYFAL